MKYRFFDTHTHYNHPVFQKDLASVMEKIREAGVLRDAVVGYDLMTSLRAVEMAAEDPRHVAVAGIHPSYVNSAGEEDLETLRALAEEERIAAVGEIGLDYHRRASEEGPDRELQKAFFREQLRMAKAAKLPVVIHSRDAAEDTLNILTEEDAGVYGGVIHCYSYSREMALRFQKLGFFLGIGGVITYTTGRRLREVVEAVPLSGLVLETDCPYLSPEGKKGVRNDSTNLQLFAEKIAEIKGIDIDSVAAQVWENSCSLYGVKD